MRRASLDGVVAMLLAMTVFWGLALQTAHAETTIKVGSKAFTEGVILGDIAAGMVEASGHPVETRHGLGGTTVVFEALKAGDIDVYVDYTGTLSREVLSGLNLQTDDEIRAALADLDLGMSAPLGFNNTFAIAIRRDADPALQSISDLTSRPEFRMGFSNEFVDRADGWPGLVQAYNLPQTNVRGMEHELAYRAIAAGSVDATDGYSTDANIARYDLRLLADDRDFFPDYEAVVLYRLDLATRAPGLIEKLKELEGTINEETMVALNARVAFDGNSEAAVAASFLEDSFGIVASVTQTGFWQRLWRNTLDHLTLVIISLGAAIIIAIPLGITAFRNPRGGQLILGTIGIAQTIPSLALFVFLIPLVGIGGPPAMIALFFYSLLPIVRNTYAGLSDIAPPLRESAEALGLPKNVILRKIELPLAARSILSGIKTAAVINVGTATLGALIGAGGYGQPILTGIRLADNALILEGAIPAALLALATQGLFELLERAVVPKGLRLPRSEANA